MEEFRSIPNSYRYYQKKLWCTCCFDWCMIMILYFYGTVTFLEHWSIEFNFNISDRHAWIIKVFLPSSCFFFFYKVTVFRLSDLSQSRPDDVQFRGDIYLKLILTYFYDCLMDNLLCNWCCLLIDIWTSNRTAMTGLPHGKTWHGDLF